MTFSQPLSTVAQLSLCLCTTLIVGCTGTSPSTQPTPDPSASASQPNPTVSANAQTELRFQHHPTPLLFGNGQSGVLKLTRQEEQVSGELTVTAGLGIQQFTHTIQTGNYPLKGSIILPNHFVLDGNFPAPLGSFSVSGTFPTLTEPGVVRVTSQGETVSAVIPALNALSSPTTHPGPVSASASPELNIVAKTWTDAELEAIAVCFQAQQSGKLADYKGGALIRAFAQTRSRLEGYRAIKSSVSAEAHQKNLNKLGTDATRMNSENGTPCVN